MSDEPAEYRAATTFLDSDHPVVTAFAERAVGDAVTPTERAVRLYYAVRDEILYDVYDTDLSPEGLKASAIISRGSGFCVHKAIVYAAVGRSVGLATRIGLADVRNHLASDRLKSLVGGEVFRFHSFNSVHLDGRWVKATPVFNKILCRLYGITPLEFDGTADSIYHPYNQGADSRMEFLADHGEFADFPYDMVVPGIRKAHPRLFQDQHRTTGGSLPAEAKRGLP